MLRTKGRCEHGWIQDRIFFPSLPKLGGFRCGCRKVDWYRFEFEDSEVNMLPWVKIPKTEGFPLLSCSCTLGIRIGQNLDRFLLDKGDHIVYHVYQTLKALLNKIWFRNRSGTWESQKFRQQLPLHAKTKSPHTIHVLGVTSWFLKIMISRTTKKTLVPVFVLDCLWVMLPNWKLKITKWADYQLSWTKYNDFFFFFCEPRFPPIQKKIP